MTYVDELHAVGMYGRRGWRHRRARRRHSRIDCLKARSAQALLLGRLYRCYAEIIDAVLSYAPGFSWFNHPRCRRQSARRDPRRDTAPQNSSGSWERHRTAALVKRSSMPAPACDVRRHPIVPLFVGDPEKCKRAFPTILLEEARSLYPADQLFRRSPGKPSGCCGIRRSPFTRRPDRSACRGAVCRSGNASACR